MFPAATQKRPVLTFGRISLRTDRNVAEWHRLMGSIDTILYLAITADRVIDMIMGEFICGAWCIMCGGMKDGDRLFD